MKPIKFNKLGRMLHHPEFHQRQWKPWTNHEQKFLIEHYDSLGPEECSLSLERTIQSVMQKMTKLRKEGFAPPADAKRKYHKRTMRELATQGAAA